MEKHIPYEKLSKKEKRKLDAAKRNTWGALNPVTRKPASSKAYNRKKAQDWKKDISSPALFVYIVGASFARPPKIGTIFGHSEGTSSLFA